MDDKERIVSAVNVNNKASQLSIRRKEKIGTPFSGEKAEIFRVDATLTRGGKERRVGKLVTKIFVKPEATRDFVNIYNYLKSQGFPVPRTVRNIYGENAVLMTDLTEGGRKQVFSRNELSLIEDQKVGSIQNIVEIGQQLREITEKADSLGVIISEDAYFLVMNQEGRGEIVLADYIGVRIPRSEQPDRYKNERYRQLTLRNAGEFYSKITEKFNI